MAIKFKIEKFEGPLDLLLQIVEREELPISEVALSEVTDQYLEYLEHSPGIAKEELADFLVVATRLLYLKSRLLLPDIGLNLEGEGFSLEDQLRMYKAFAEAAKRIESKIKERKFTFARSSPSLQPGFFSPPKTLSAARLGEVMGELLENIRPILELPQKALARVISIKEKIDEIRALLGRGIQVSWEKLIKKAANRTEVVVSFLALLELIKQRTAEARQNELFDDILIGAGER